MTDVVDPQDIIDEQVKLDDDLLTRPYPLYQLLREQRPVVPVRLPTGIRGWLVTRHSDAKAALTDPRLAKDHRMMLSLLQENSDEEQLEAVAAEQFTAHMLNSDPPDHTRLRRLVGRAFTMRNIARLRPRIEEIANGLLDEVAAEAARNGGEVDLIDTFAFPLPITVISELLGVPLDQRDDFRQWSNTILSNAEPQQRRAASEAMMVFLRRLIDDKRANPGPDMLSAIVAATEDADQLSEAEAISMAFLLMVAGHETTVNLIGNGMLALLRHPDQLTAMRADPGLTPNAIEEFLRFDGPVNIATLRYTTEPVTIAGTTIPENQFVLVGLASANRDPEQFPDADRLDIRRDASHLAFGHGIHYCLGAPLARLEGEIAFNNLLARFPEITLAREPDELVWRAGSIIRGLDKLPVRVGSKRVTP